MTQQWGMPGQPPNPGAQSWPGQPGWNRPAQTWGVPAPAAPPQYQQPQYPGPYPQGQVPYPQAAGQPPGRFGPQAQFGQPGYGQPGSFQPVNRGYQPGGPRRSPFRGVLLGLVLVIGIGFFAVSLMHYLDGGTSEVANNRPTATPTAPPVSVPAPDVDPPALPVPETYEEAELWLTENAAYAQAAAVPTDCPIPPIDPAGASNAELRTHLDNLTACLWRVWSGPLEAAGFELPRPPVTIYAEEITTPCGSQPEFNASYCGANQHIYYDRRVYRIFPEELQRTPFLVETVLGHEFGHTIQARTGIMISSMAFEAKAKETSQAAANVFSRRLEVQADCFAGLFTAAVGDASGLSAGDLTSLRQVAYNLGDDVLTGKENYDGGHGLGESRERWFTTGQETDQLATCNTFTVPANQVR